MVVVLLALWEQGPEEGYALTTDSPRPYQPFQTLQPESLNVKLLGYIEDTTIGILDLAASEDGNYVYATAGGNGLVIYDVRDPYNPREIKRLSIYSSVGYVEVAGHYLYLSGRYETLKGYFCVYDISDPENPVYLSELEIGESSYLTVNGSIAYAASIMVYSIDISDPANPVILDSFPRYSKVHSYCDSTLYLLDTDYGDPSETTWVYILDVSDPTDIKELNRIWLPGGQMSCVAAWKDTFNLFSPTYGHIFLYVLGGIWADYIWDVTDPLKPELVWEGRTGFGGGYWVYLHSKFSYVSENLEVYDREIEPDGFYTVGYYRNSAYGGKMIWTKGVIVMRAVYWFIKSPLAIFQFSGDTLVSDSDTSNPYIDWVRTVYDRPGLEFSLLEEASVSFSLYTALGAKAYQKDLGLLEPGPHIITLPNMRPGVYVLLMKTNDRSFSTNIVFTEGD